MINTLKRALEYALALSDGNPTEIKKTMADYLATAGCDRRYKIKWRACSGNHKYIFSGIFEYAGGEYYFSNMLGEIELDRI